MPNICSIHQFKQLYALWCEPNKCNTATEDMSLHGLNCESSGAIVCVRVEDLCVGLCAKGRYVREHVDRVYLNLNIPIYYSKSRWILAICSGD